jgi:hypothetical protein
MKVKDYIRLLFSDQLEKEVDKKTLMALQFPTEDGTSVLECDALEVGEVVSLVDADGNKTTPEDGDYEITDENGETNIVTIASGKIEAVEPGEAESEEEQPAQAPNEMAKDNVDPIENHPLVKEAKQKLDLARAKAKVETAKNEVDALKSPKKDDAPAEVDEEAPAPGTDNPDETLKPKATPKVAPKKMAKKLSTEKVGESEPKDPKETGGKEGEDKKILISGKPVDVAKSQKNSVGNKYTNTYGQTKMSASEKLRVSMKEEKEEKEEIKKDPAEELKLVKAELALQKEKMKVLLSESKPLKVSKTTIMDKVSEGDQKLSKSEFIKKHILGREDI